jgi:hypothetical protein
MNQLPTEAVESSQEAFEQEVSGCPFHTGRASLEADEELVLPEHKLVFTQYSTDASGAAELRLYYGDKEISFDDPELFAFGERLAAQPRFVAGTAATWGKGYEWARVRKLLEQLIEEGVLQRAQATTTVSRAASSEDGVRPSPLPPAQSTVPRTWFECEAITGELTGHSLELGYLELAVPIFRVAHIAMDSDGRQVGEANVFPEPLRLDVPTKWRTCLHAGSRYRNDRPMNVTALKTMRQHWAQMMAALLRIREAYLRRFPRARNGWTVGDLERLSTLVLTVPAYLLMRAERRVENGRLHPALSSMFRVIDGVRMTMHLMLFLPTREPTLAPDAPMTGAEIYAYAERNDVFVSEHGVCAGPKVMIEELLSVLVDGQSVNGAEAAVIDAQVEVALEHLDPAFDYALYGLQAYAVVFSLWPAMSRAYELLWTIVEAWPGDLCGTAQALRQHLKQHVEFLRAKSLLATEEWRAARDRVYADMYAQCAAGLGATEALAERIAPVCAAQHAEAAARLRAALRRRFCGTAAADEDKLESLVDGVMDYLRREQAIVRAACGIQRRINRLLGRSAPTQPFTASSIDIFNQLQGELARLPYLVRVLEEVLELRIVVTQDAIQIADCAATGADCDQPFIETGQHGAGESTCDGHGLEQRRWP